MRLVLRYSTLSTLYYIACMLCLLLYTFLSMRTMEHNVDSLSGTRTLSALCLLVCVLSVTRLYWVKGYLFYRPTTTMMLYIIYMLWVLVPTLLHDIESGSLSDVVTVIIDLLLPLSTLMITYNHMLNYGSCRWLRWVFCAMSLIYAIGYARIFMATLYTGGAIQMIISYFTLYMLPLILLSNGRKTSIFFVLFTFLCLMTSVKRGGLVALAGGLVVFGIVYFLTARKKSIGMIVTSIVLVCLLVAGFIYIGSMDENGVIERFENMESDDGSGRMVVWYKTCKLIGESEAVPLLVGHGYNKVSLDSQAGLSAHNDFLEVTYDYGLIGLCLYLAAYLSLFALVMRLIRGRSIYAPTMAMFFTIYFVLSMVSHIIIYPWANLIMLTIGYVSAREKLDSRAVAYARHE